MARAVARIIALALDLDGDFFDKPYMLGEPIATLRLLHYQGVEKTRGYCICMLLWSSCQRKYNAIYGMMVAFVWSLGTMSNPSKGIYGAGAHSDYGLITLLATDDVVGLQVRWCLVRTHFLYNFL